MAFSCSVYALDAAAKRRLKLAGISVPMAVPSGRDPTPRELMQVLAAIADYQVNVWPGPGPGQTSWYADVWHAHRPAIHPSRRACGWRNVWPKGNLVVY